MDKDKLDKLIDCANDVKDVAHDIVSPSAKNIGNALGTFTGFFSDVVLYPLKKLNAKFELKAIQFEKELKEKYEKIPDNCKTQSSVNVLGPALESLKYNIDEDYMRELFSNLLCADMDLRKKSNVHPKYVRVIESMNSMDAKIFNYLYLNYGRKYLKCGHVDIKIKGTNNVYSNALPQWIISDNIENFSIFDISKSLIRLANLGLLDLMYGQTAGPSCLNNLYVKDEVQKIFAKYKEINQEIELSGTDCIIMINDDGICFGKIVFNK